MAKRRATVFVSYSHVDSEFVAPVVSLLRATRAIVFRDADSIRPGKKWREVIGLAIQQADLAVVFWCSHSNASLEVHRELALALVLGKDIVPVLLDASPLPKPLFEFEYIDFRKVAETRHAEAQILPGPPVPLYRTRHPLLMFAAVAAGTVGALLATVCVIFLNRHYDQAMRGFGFEFLAVMLTVGLIVYFWCLTSVRFRRWCGWDKSFPICARGSLDVQTELAAVIRAQILKKLRMDPRSVG